MQIKIYNIYKNLYIYYMGAGQSTNGQITSSPQLTQLQTDFDSTKTKIDSIYANNKDLAIKDDLIKLAKTSDITSMQSGMVKPSDLTEINKKIDNIQFTMVTPSTTPKMDLSGLAQKSDLSGFAKQSDFKELNTKLDNIQTTIANLNVKSNVNNTSMNITCPVGWKTLTSENTKGFVYVLSNKSTPFIMRPENTMCMQPASITHKIIEPPTIVPKIDNPVEEISYLLGIPLAQKIEGLDNSKIEHLKMSMNMDGQLITIDSIDGAIIARRDENLSPPKEISCPMGSKYFGNFYDILSMGNVPMCILDLNKYADNICPNGVHVDSTNKPYVYRCR